MERIAVGLAITAVAILVARWATTPRVAAVVQRVESALQTRWMAAATGLVTAAIVWWCWGSIRQVPYAQDERAYVLQASIFAARHWTTLSPPLPQFFEQMHVLVSPTVAAKYPPGHSLILALGAWLGLPGLGPLALSAVTALKCDSSSARHFPTAWKICWALDRSWPRAFFPPHTTVMPSPTTHGVLGIARTTGFWVPRRDSSFSVETPARIEMISVSGRRSAWTKVVIAPAASSGFTQIRIRSAVGTHAR